MVVDHLSDFIARFKNANRAGLKMVEVPATKAVVRVAEVLVKEGYAESQKVEGKTLIVELKYKDNKPVIMDIKRVSKPGVRIYSSISSLPKVWGGLGINILSTSKGVMSEKEAKKLHTGGEVICQVW